MKRLILIGLLTLALPRPGFASNDSIAALVAKGDALDQQFKTQESLSAYLEAEKLGGNEADLLRKIAREYALAMPDAKAKAEKLALSMTATAVPVPSKPRSQAEPKSMESWAVERPVACARSDDASARRSRRIRKIPSTASSVARDMACSRVTETAT